MSTEQRKPYLPPNSGSAITLRVCVLTEKLQEIEEKVEKNKYRTDFWGLRTLKSCANKMADLTNEVRKLKSEVNWHTGAKQLVSFHKKVKNKVDYISEKLGLFDEKDDK